MGQIAETAGIGNGADRLVSVAGVQKQAVCVSKALGEYVLGERGAFVLEQHMDIAGRHALA